MKSPAFQFYPDKWQTDTRRLSWSAKGIYHELMCVVWLQFQETCSIPNDDDFIAGELGCELSVWSAAKAELLNPHRPILTLTETNRLFISGLYKELEKQEIRRERLRQNGMLGGRPKNQKVIFDKPKNKAGSENLNERLPSPSPSPSLKEDIYSPESRIALHWLNEKSGKHFRESNSSLAPINARMKEDGVSIDGVKKMIQRQCVMWRGTRMQEYLRPETLFGKEKFNSYYAAKDLPVSFEDKKQPIVQQNGY